MSAATDVDAIVVGGGIAGLNAARVLAERGLAPMVLEARGRPGGLVFGDDLGGVAVDLGAESFAKRSVYTARLCDELGLELIDPSGRSWIWDRGRAFPIPHGVLGIPTSLDDPDVIEALTPEGLERARADLSMGPDAGADCRDLASLVRVRLGDEVLDRLVTPVAGGVHSTNPARLAADVVTPGLRGRLAAEGSLVAAAAAQRAAAPAGAVVSSVRGGLFRLTLALARRITDAGGEIWTKQLVTALCPAPGGWAVQVDAAGPSTDPAIVGAPAGQPATITARRVLVALDGRAALGLLRGVPRLEVGDDDLPRGADLASIDIALDHPALDAGPRGSGLLVAPPDDGVRPDVAAKALTHYSIKWPWVHDDGGPHVLRVSYGRGPGTPTPTLAGALTDASTLLGVPLTSGNVRAHRVVRFPNSLPPQTPAHRERVAALAASLETTPGLGVAGAWFAGTGLAAVLPQAEAAAGRLIEGND